MAVFSEDFKDKLKEIWYDYDVFFIFLIILIVFLAGMLIMVSIHSSVIETKADGGLIIDKFITEGHYYFMVLIDKNEENEYERIGVRPERYYTTQIGDIYNKN